MNREQLEKTISQIWGKCDAGSAPKDIADFILENFDPKQETERVTPARIYEAMITGYFASHANPGAPSPLYSTDYTLVVQRAYEAAAAFNNYKPESHEH